MLIGKGDRPDLIEVVGGLVALALTSDMTAGAAAAMARRVERAEKAQQHLADARAAEERAAEEQRKKAVAATKTYTCTPLFKNVGHIFEKPKRL